MRNNRILFLILGLFFIAIGGLLLVTNLVADEPFNTSFLLMFALAVMCFCLSYLSPHFLQKDERMKLIREKGMFFSVIALIVYLIIFNLGLQIEFFILAANELLHILTALIICTIFISFVVYSRIY